MSLSNSNSTHAYIVRARGEAVSSPFVLALVSEMLCSAQGQRPCGVCAHCNKIARGVHPDVTVISRLEGKKDIQVDQIREAVFSASLLPNEAERRVILINRADEMNANAQNALLKLLEEPPRHIVMLLITEAPGELLPTVRSRCRVVEGGGENADIPEDIKALAMRYVTLALAGGEPLVEFSFELESVEKRDFALFLTEARGLTASQLRSALEDGTKKGLANKAREIIDALEKAGEFLNRNVSTMHISALLCAFAE